MSRSLTTRPASRALPARRTAAPRPAPAGLPAEDGSLTADALFVLRAARRHWLVVLLLTALVAGLALAYALLREPTYHAQASVLVRTGETPETADAIGDALTARPPSRTVENELSVLRRSHALAASVLARVDVSEIEAEAREEAGDEAAALTPAHVADYLLRERVAFEPATADGDVIEITAEAHTPRLAAALATAYAEEYADFARSGGGSGVASTRAFLEDAVDEQRAELEASEERLRAFLEREGIVALDAQERSAVEQAASVESDLSEARTELALRRRELADVERELARVEPGLQRQVASSAPQEIAELQARVAELEAQAADYYATDPTLRGNEARSADLQALRRRIDEIRAQITARSSDYVDRALATGGVGRGETGGSAALTYASELQREVLRRRIGINGLAARVASLEQRLGRTQQRLGGLPTQRVDLAQLERERVVAEDRYVSLVERLEQARAAQSLQQDDVQVVRAALAPLEPAGPSPALLLALGLVAGGLLGVGAAVAAELRGQQHPRTRAEVEAVGFETLGVLPRRPGAHAAHPFHLLEDAGEAVRRLRIALVNRTQQRPCVVTVTSPSAGDGKSSTAIALAGSMAQAGLRTLYVDADFYSRDPRGALLSPHPSGSLLELLRNGEAVDWSLFRYTDGNVSARLSGNLYVVPSGVYDDLRGDESLTDLLARDRAELFVDQARAAFDVIIFDSPPVLSTVDPLLLGALSDVLLVVAAAGRTSEAEFDRVRERLGDLGIALPATVGVVLNKATGTAS